MGFVWLTALKNSAGQILKFIVPSYYAYDWNGSYTGLYSIVAGNYSTPEELEFAMGCNNDVALQKPDPSFLKASDQGQYVFEALGGRLRTETVQDGGIPRNVTTYYAEFVGKTTITNSYTGPIYDDEYNGWYYDSQRFGLCAAYDAENHHLFFGLCYTFHGNNASDPSIFTYDTRIMMADYPTQDLWDYFVEYVPSSGPGPYDQGGTSETGGGENATYDDASEEIDVPSIPLLNLTFSGFMSAYAPTLTQVQDLATYVWSDWDSGNYLNKLFANVADAIISLHMLPFSPSASTTPADVMVGKYDSGVDMFPLNAQFNDVDCGTLKIPLYWDNYLDYNPYTKLTLFLPYVGEITLNPDEVMGQTIGIKYRVDALTGAFVCFITRSDHKIVGQYQGNCALSVPISSANYAQLHAAMLTIATAAVGAAAATGGAVAGLAAGGEAGIEAALGVMDTKVRHNVSGALGSAAGFMGSQKPYLIIERARQCLPEDLGQFKGYPSQITETLGSLSGFTQVAEIILDGIPLTDQELEELRGILSEGVIL